MKTCTLSISDIEAIRQTLGLEADDTSSDPAILVMRRNEQLNRIVQWNGPINDSATIEAWVGRVWGITL